MRTRSRKGFTLIELIIVIVVLGILAGIAIAGYTAVIRRSNISSVEQSATSFNREILNLATQKAAQSGTQTGLATDKTTRDGNLLWEAFEAADGPKGVTVMGLIDDGSGTLSAGVIWDGSKTATGLVSPANLAASTPGIAVNQYYLQFVKNGASICMRLSNTGAQAYDQTPGGTPTGDAVDPNNVSDTGASGLDQHAGWVVMKRVSNGSATTANAANACNDVLDNNSSSSLEDTTAQTW